MNELDENHRGLSGRRLGAALLAIALMFVLFAFIRGEGNVVTGLWIWLLLFIWLVVLWSLLTSAERIEPEHVLGPRMLPPEEQPPVVREIMEVRLAEEEQGVQVFRGRLRESPDAALGHLKDALAPGAVPLLRSDQRCDAAVVVLPRAVEKSAMERPVRPWLHVLLFFLTFLTTTWAGAAHQGVNLLAEPERFAVGLPYALALLAILGTHELGHYCAARYHGMDVTPPFFIPVPFALGTFGAFIQMRSPAENRRVLFDVAVAGPLAGLVVAIPALLIGLQSSTILPIEAPRDLLEGTAVGSSFLFALLAKLALGDALQLGCVVQLSPLAFAGWLGLFITGLNLIPVGQLDGGHIARAMFGARGGEFVSRVAMWTLLLLALFVWPGLLIWALLIFFIARRGAPPLNDLSPAGRGRVAIGCFAFAILALVFAPVPAAALDFLGVECPYF